MQSVHSSQRKQVVRSYIAVGVGMLLAPFALSAVLDISFWYKPEMFAGEDYLPVHEQPPGAWLFGYGCMLVAEMIFAAVSLLVSFSDWRQQAEAALRQREQRRQQLLDALRDETNFEKQDVERYRQLVAEREGLALQEKQASALVQIFEDLLAKKDQENRRNQRLYFVLGLAVSIPTGLLVNWMS